MPQLHDACANLCVVGRKRFGSQQIFGLHALAHRVPRGEQSGNVALRIQNALALHLGRVGGEHGRHIAVRQRIRYGFWSNTSPTHAGQRHFYAALLRITRTLVHLAAANVVAVFGQIGQMAEVGEGADHAHRLVAREPFEQGLQGLVGLRVRVAPKRHRELAHLLHQLVRSQTLLLANHIAQHPPQQADVVNERLVFGLLFHPGMLAPEVGQGLQTGYGVRFNCHSMPSLKPASSCGSSAAGRGCVCRWRRRWR